NGLLTTTQWDATGAGTFDLTQTDTVVLNADGSKRETVAYAGARHDQTITTTSADLNTITVQRDLNGDGVLDQTSVATRNADGSITSTASDFNANATLKDREVTTVIANGLATTIQRDTTGAGTFSQTETDVITLNPDGSRTETVNCTKVGGSGYRMVVTTSANGLLTQTQWDLTGSGTFGHARIDETSLNGDGGTTEIITDLTGSNNVKADEYAVTITGNGLSKLKQWDTNGDGTFDQTSTDNTVINSDGSRTETVTAFKGTLLSKSVVTTSADGLSV